MWDKNIWVAQRSGSTIFKKLTKILLFPQKQRTIWGWKFWGSCSWVCWQHQVMGTTSSWLMRWEPRVTCSSCFPSLRSCWSRVTVFTQQSSVPARSSIRTTLRYWSRMCLKTRMRWWARCTWRREARACSMWSCIRWLGKCGMKWLERSQPSLITHQVFQYEFM